MYASGGNGHKKDSNIQLSVPPYRASPQQGEQLIGQDKVAFDIIRNLHRMMDDDLSGSIDPKESTEVIDFLSFVFMSLTLTVGEGLGRSSGLG
ncbi:unnamed protein product [Soboliphyme baturini]|uniref:EF-hand domain-containing protein n=1 Tax=Soboliphyme baturini TaxID=241478 RepID=A0A183IRC6_9BILA|nr:unnamed protein product [Soboliphyme baturini]